MSRRSLVASVMGLAMALSLPVATSTASQAAPATPAAATPCTNGMAGNYPCNNIDLQSVLPLSSMGGGSGAGGWGWTDPNNGKEYAIVARSNGTAFVDITNPTTPV